MTGYVYAVDTTDLGIIIPLVVSMIGSAVAVYQSRSTTTSKTLELGVVNLVDQLQEEMAGQRAQVKDCNDRCQGLEARVAELEQQVSDLTDHNAHLETENDDYSAEIIRLKRKAGEL